MKPAEVTPLTMPGEAQAPPISHTLSSFAHDLRYEHIPEAVRERARHLLLDATGIALASTRWDFAHKSLAALGGLGGAGPHTVIGLPARLPVRDAVTLNGILVHGLDYDDTHVPGIIHATASAWPCALGAGEHAGASGRDVLAAYVVGVEAGARLGAVARGAFHQVGFHPTGLIGAFGCTLLAGKLLGANAAQLTKAQGIALSMGAGSLEFLEDGSWTKRLHPGWAGAAGLTAASLARQGFIGPEHAYEGRFGLFPSHLGSLAEGCDYALATAGLGDVWEIEQVAVKPFPVCHFAHGCADAAIALHDAHALAPEDIARVRVRVPGEVVKTICEPVAHKLRPVSDYDAKFSVQFIVAASLVRGRFGLPELEPGALHDEDILALARRVEYEADPASPFPRAYSGEVALTTRDGRELSHREEINRGAAQRPLTNAEIEAKFMDNAQMAVSRQRAERIRDLLLELQRQESLAALGAALGGQPQP